MRTVPLILISLILIIAITACGGASATSTPVPVNTPVDTPAPVEPAESDLPTLSQSVTSENGVTVSYPEGWLDPIATIGVFLYNNADGQAIMNFMRARAGGLAFQINTQPNSSERTPVELFDFTFSGLATGLGITLGAPETITLGEAEVLKATGANTAEGSQLGMYVALKPVSEGFVTFVVYLHPDEIEAQTPLIEAILDSITYTAP